MADQVRAAHRRAQHLAAVLSRVPLAENRLFVSCRPRGPTSASCRCSAGEADAGHAARTRGGLARAWRRCLAPVHAMQRRLGAAGPCASRPAWRGMPPGCGAQHSRQRPAFRQSGMVVQPVSRRRPTCPPCSYNKTVKKIVGKGGLRWYKNIGLGFRTPKEAIEGEPQQQGRQDKAEQQRHSNMGSTAAVCGSGRQQQPTWGRARRQRGSSRRASHSGVPRASRTSQPAGSILQTHLDSRRRQQAACWAAPAAR